MSSIIKEEFFDKFQCTAGECPFTCCRGWEISIDTDTYTRWIGDEEKAELFRRNSKPKKQGRQTKQIIKMDSGKSCPFLDNKGLCNIVKEYGEDYQPKTCREFPRQINHYGEFSEYSLSCTCPAVVDIINSANGKIKFEYNGEKGISEISTVPVWADQDAGIRNIMLSILQKSRFPLKDKLLIIFQMLLSIKTKQIAVKDILDSYQDEEYLLSLIKLWEGIEPEYIDSYQETKELFLDIAMNYRNEKSYRRYLYDIYGLAEETDMNHYHVQWEKFKNEFKQFELLMEKCLISKIFSNCIDEDINELIMSYQLLIMEYVLVRYSAFLRWLIKGEAVSSGKQPNLNTNEPDYCDIRDYIVVYSRIIGYNADGIKEFWEESFEEAIWEFGYLFLLINLN